MQGITNNLDWVYTFFLIIFLLLVAKNYVKKRPDDILVQKYFYKALLIKLGGGIAFALYHLYIFKGGDTFGFFLTGRDIARLVLTDPDKYFTLMTSSFEKLSESGIFDTVRFTYGDGIMWVSAANFFVVRFVTLFAPFALNGYLATVVIFAVFTFLLIWRAFKRICEIYPDSTNLVAIAFLFFPTVVFWGSGLGKDSLMLGSLCGFTAAAFDIFVFRRNYVKNLLLICLFGYWLYICKSYILFSYFGPLAFAVFFHRVMMVKGFLLKGILGLFALAMFGVIIYFGLNLVLNEFASDQALAEYMASTAVIMQEAGSKYDLGIKPEQVGSLGDLLSFFPIAVITAFFRPWLWEARNPAMLLSALESAFVLFLFLRILLTGFIVKTIGYIRKNPIIFANLVYAIIFCGFVTLSTGNFGTLVRYKLPAMPYLIFSLLIINKKQRAGGKSLTGY